MSEREPKAGERAQVVDFSKSCPRCGIVVDLAALIPGHLVGYTPEALAELERKAAAYDEAARDQVVELRRERDEARLLAEHYRDEELEREPARKRTERPLPWESP